MDIFKVYWFHNKHLFVFHYQTIMLKCCLSLIILWRIDKHYICMLRWDDDQWPQCLPPSAASHSPRSNGSVPSLRQPQAVARISQDWLTGNEHARLDNADILGEISSSGYWELLAFMQFIGVSIFIEEDSVARQAVCLLVGIRLLSPRLTFWQVNTCCREKFTKDFPQVLSVKFGKHLISTH